MGRSEEATLRMEDRTCCQETQEVCPSPLEESVAAWRFLSAGWWREAQEEEC